MTSPQVDHHLAFNGYGKRSTHVITPINARRQQVPHTSKFFITHTVYLSHAIPPEYRIYFSENVHV
jgi:hypothetical protein